VDPKIITPILVGVLFLWSMYRRVRRSFGRQPVQEGRLMVRAGLFVVVGGLILFYSTRDLSLLAPMVIGIAGGTLLGFVGLRHTKFESTAAGRFYTPHTYIGLFVTALFVVRIVIRYVNVYANPHLTGPPQNPLAAYQNNPLTLGALGVVVGYYVFFNVGVLLRSRASTAIAADTTDSPPSVS
jgi:hypothetical protein